MKTTLSTFFILLAVHLQAQIYSTNASSIANGSGTAVVTSGVNNGQISAGTFTGTSDFNPGAGSFPLTAGSSGSMYVQSLGTNNEFYWAFAIPNAGVAKMLAAADGIYIVGSFTGTVDFNPSTSITTNLTSLGMSDCYIMKVNYSDGSLIWAKSFGGTNLDAMVSITSDGSVNSSYIYITGTFKGTADLDPSPTATSNITSNGDLDIFVTKLNASGALQWTRSIGGSGSDFPTDMQASETDFTLSGQFTGTVDFDPNAGIANQTVVNYTNMASFLVRWNSSSTYQWARMFDQPDGQVRINCFIVTPSNIYIAGDCFGAYFYQNTSGMNTSITPNNLNAGFCSKYTVDASQAEWVMFVQNPLGSPQSQETITDMVCGPGTNPAIYMVGTFLGTICFQPNATTNAIRPLTMTSANNGTTFFFRINGDSNLKWGYSLQNCFGNFGNLPTLTISEHAGQNHVYMTAKFNGTQDFDFGSGTVSRTSIGSEDSFVAKWSDTY